MKQVVKFALFVLCAVLVFGVFQSAEAASAKGQPPTVPADVKKVDYAYDFASSWANVSDPNQEFSYISVRAENVTKSATGVPAGTSSRMDVQLQGGCSSQTKGCDSIYFAVEIPLGSYVVDEVARAAHLAIKLTDPGVKFLFGWRNFQDGTFEELSDFPAFLGNSVELHWSIPMELKNPASGNATLTFTDLCGGKGRTDASQLDGSAQISGQAFGYKASSLLYGGGYLVFRHEMSSVRYGCGGPVVMPQIVFNYGGRG